MTLAPASRYSEFAAFTPWPAPDSIATLKLVMFIEEQFGVQVQAHEADREHLDTLADIVQLIASKK